MGVPQLILDGIRFLLALAAPSTPSLAAEDAFSPCPLPVSATLKAAPDAVDDKAVV